MERLTIYSKERCVQCVATYRALGKAGIDSYNIVDLSDVPNKIEEFKAEGLLQAPIVDTGQERWSGFRPDKIKEYAQSIETR